MKLAIYRSGGYAGLAREQVAAIDTASLDPARARAIKEAVDRAARSTPPVGADMMRLDIEIIDDDGRKRSLVLCDDGNPSGVAGQLLETLTLVP